MFKRPLAALGQARAIYTGINQSQPVHTQQTAHSLPLPCWLMQVLVVMLMVLMLVLVLVLGQI
jgi:type VI protein secretion system component VasF